MDQPYKYVGTWWMDEWRKIGRHVTRRVVPTGAWYEAMRSGSCDVGVEASCNSVVNPLLDVQKYLPRAVFSENYGNYDDQPEIDLYQKMLHETDGAKQRALMREFEKHVLDTQAHELVITYWNRIVPLRSYVKGWKIGPSHYVNQDLANVWLDQSAPSHSLTGPPARPGSDAQDVPIYREPGAARCPDAGRRC